MQKSLGSPLSRLKMNSMLVGPYSCCYCREPCASDSRFHIFFQGADGRLEKLKAAPHEDPPYFCTPECAAGYNQFMLNEDPSVIGARHRLLEKKHSRNISCAPPPQLLCNRALPRSRGVPRMLWLPECRENLTMEEWEMTHREMEFDQTHSSIYDHRIK